MKKRIVAMLLVLALCASVFAAKVDAPFESKLVNRDSFKAEIGLKFDFDQKKALKFDTAFVRGGLVKNFDSNSFVEGIITYVHSVSGTDFVGHYNDYANADTSIFGSLNMDNYKNSGLYVEFNGARNVLNLSSGTLFAAGLDSILYVSLDGEKLGKPESLTTRVGAFFGDSRKNDVGYRSYARIDLGHVDRFDSASENEGFIFSADLSYKLKDAVLSPLNIKSGELQACYRSVINFEELKPSVENADVFFAAFINVSNDGSNSEFAAALGNAFAQKYEADNGYYVQGKVVNKGAKNQQVNPETVASATMMFQKENGKLTNKLRDASFGVDINDAPLIAKTSNTYKLNVGYNNTAAKHDVKVDLSSKVSYQGTVKDLGSSNITPCLEVIENLTVDFYNLDSDIKMDIESATRVNGQAMTEFNDSLHNRLVFIFNGKYFSDVKVVDTVKTVKNGFDFYVPAMGSIAF